MKGLMKVPIGQRRSEAVPPPNINIPEKNPEKKETQFRWAIEQPRYVLKDLILPKITEDQIADVIAFFEIESCCSTHGGFRPGIKIMTG